MSLPLHPLHEYSTTNLAIAAALVTRGHAYTGLRPADKSRAYFTFADTSELRVDLLQISEGTLPLDVLRHDQVRRELQGALRAVMERARQAALSAKGAE